MSPTPIGAGISCAKDFKMQMRAGRAPGGTHVADDCPLLNPLTRNNRIRAVVRVEGLRIVRVADDDVTPVPAIPATGTRDDNAPGCGSDHGHAELGRVVLPLPADPPERRQVGPNQHQIASTVLW